MAQIPTRLLIHQRLQALLQGITSENGYDYELGDAVFRGRIILGADVPAPALSILEAPRPDAAMDYGGEDYEARRDHLTLLIQGIVENDIENPTDPAYYLEAAVEHRLSRILATNPRNGSPLYQEHYNLGGLITQIEIGAPVVRPPENNVSKTAFFFLPVRVGIVGRTDDPYTSV